MSIAGRAGQVRPLEAALVASAVLVVVTGIVLATIQPSFSLLALLPAGALVVARHRLRTSTGLHIDELSRLGAAEVALASAPDTEAAARELAEHAIALLSARAAVVLIEGVGDTVRVAAGNASSDTVYSPGSRMRLLDDAGIPCGSIAVSARADGRPYDERDERILDALAQRVSSTLHRVSLFERVRSEQRTLADVLGSSSDGIAAVGPDLQVRSWNPAMERITGIDHEDAVGERCCTVFRPADEAGEARHGATCPGRSGKAMELVLRIEAKDGGDRWLNCAFSPMSDGGYVLVARDVTARKQIEDEKADFLATVSHELRTPLTPIKGFVQTLMRRDDFSRDERQHIYEVLLREEQRLERLVDQLLEATSIDRAERLFVPELVDWSSLVAENVDALRRSDPSRQIEITALVGAEEVVADPQLAGQILTNLLSNAVKYSGPTDPIDVCVSRQGDVVVTTVRDHGPGVAEGDRQRIFEKFTRLGDHLTRPQQGVGLGLFIARRAAETSGGSIWVEPAPGGGSVFGFALPAPARAAALRRG